MVGVPGKNNGCHNCRRRRIRCDRAVPNCLRCSKSGLECEGYARGSVFINRTADGLSRRRYFDEARLRSTEQQQLVAGNKAIPLIGKTIGYGDSLTQGLKGHFLDSWLPSSDPVASPLGAWVIRAFGISQPGELLNRSLSALIITLTGHQRRDAAMAQYGRTQYGLALNALQWAVSDRQLAVQDSTLAAIQALRLYELSVSTNVIANVTHHVKGSTKLLTLRGSKSNNSPLSKAITKDLRYAAMTCALQFQDRSPLGDGEWRTRAPRTYIDWENSLTDRGFDLATLVHDFRTVSWGSLTPSATTALINREYHPRATAIGQELKRWYDSAVQDGRISPKWPYPALDEMPPRATTPESRRTSIDLDLLSEALLVLDYWGLSLALEIITDMIRQKDTNHSEDAEAKKERRERQLRLSENIFAVAEYQSREEHGFNAASRCTLATRAALYPLRTHDGPGIEQRRVDAEEFIRNLAQRSGIRYAGELMNKKGNWREGKDEQAQTAAKAKS